MSAETPNPANVPEAALQAILELRAADVAAAVDEVLAVTREPRYRGRQLLEWVYRRTPASFADMSNLPKALRGRLAERFRLHTLHMKEAKRSVDGTTKYLWARDAGGVIESVAIPDRERLTFCISTQVGCPVKCTFCATGYGGFAGQLSAADMVDQVLLMRRQHNRVPTNIVYMGMGEPLLNTDAVLHSLDVLTDPRQVDFGARRITVSTVGVPDGIRALAGQHPQVKLALSLHAANDTLRNEIIPLNRRHPLEEVLGAVAEHAATTGKKATFEYVVLPGVNDSAADARAVAQLVRGIPSRINLIEFNPFAEAPYSRPSIQRLTTFRRWLERHYPGTVTIRRSRGRDIDGACGQLSLKNAQRG